MFNQYLIRDTDGGINHATIHTTGQIIEVTHNKGLEISLLKNVAVDPRRPQPGFYKYTYTQPNDIPTVTLKDKGVPALTIEQTEPELLTIRHGEEVIHLTDQQLIDLVHIVEEFIYSGRLSECSPIPQ